MQLPLTTVPTLELTARNTAADSENKIHDDAEARRYGYGGGLVPGVTLYAYLTRLAVAVYGVDWLARGQADFSARRPVYAGERVRCAGEMIVGPAGDSVLVARVTRDNTLCAEGTFVLPDQLSHSPSIEAGPARTGDLPVLSPDTVPLGVPLAPLYAPFTVEDAAAYADSTDDPAPWYRGASPFGGPLVPPGWLAARQAPLIRANFSFGPSIHVRSVMRHVAPPLAGQTFVTRGVIRQSYERKGNHYLVMDAETLDAAGQPVCRVEHTTIFAVRTAQPAG